MNIFYQCRHFVVKVISAIAIVFYTLACLSLCKDTVAAELPDYRLQISPASTNLGELTPGETYTGTFSVQNTGSKDIDFTVEIGPYSVSGQEYSQSFTQQTAYTEMMNWITVNIESGTVAAGTSETIEYSIAIPANAPGSNQNAAILVTMANQDSADGMSVQTIKQLAFPIYSNVSGLTIKTGSILENKIPGFIFEPPITATSVVENTGNIYTVAKYTLEVRELFGDKLVYTNAEEANGEIIFPETERYNEVSWENAPQLGIFKAKQTIKIFDEESVVEKLVFLCPIWFLCVIIAFVAILVFMIVSRILKRRAA